MSRTGRDCAAPTAPLSTKAGQIPRSADVPQRRVVELPTATPCTKPGRSLMLAVDANVLVYAADANSQFSPFHDGSVRARAKR